MKCPKCSAEISDKTIISEAARINGSKSKRKMSPEQARELANTRWRKPATAADAKKDLGIID